MIYKKSENEQIFYLCEECGGEMVCCEDDILFTTLPPQVKYICRECGKIEFVCACRRKGE